MEKAKQLFKLFVRRLQCTVAAFIRKMLIPLQPLFRSGILLCLVFLFSFFVVGVIRENGHKRE